MDNFYTLFNLDPTANDEQIKIVIHRELRTWTNRTNAPQIDRRQEAERMVKALEQAELILTDQTRRAEYDEQLKNQQTASTESIPPVTASTNVNDLVSEAHNLLVNGRVADAVYVAQKATDLDIRNAAAWSVLGLALDRFGEPDKAIIALKRAVMAQPDQAIYHSDLGSVYESNENFAEALKCYETAYRLDSSVAMYLAASGVVLVKMGHGVEGIHILEQCVEREPDNPSYQWFLAIAYQENAYLGWTQVNQGHPLLEPGYYATDLAQVALAQEALNKALSLRFDDSELSNHLEKVKQDIDRMTEKSYVGNQRLPWIFGAVSLITLYNGGWAFGIFYLLLVALYVGGSFVPEYVINKQLVNGKNFDEFGWVSRNFFEGGSDYNDSFTIFKVLIGYCLLGVAFPVFAIYNIFRYHGSEIRQWFTSTENKERFSTLLHELQTQTAHSVELASNAVDKIESKAKEIETELTKKDGLVSTLIHDLQAQTTHSVELASSAIVEFESKANEIKADLTQKGGLASLVPLKFKQFLKHLQTHTRSSVTISIFLLLLISGISAYQYFGKPAINVDSWFDFSRLSSVFNQLKSVDIPIISGQDKSDTQKEEVEKAKAEIDTPKVDEEKWKSERQARIDAEQRETAILQEMDRTQKKLEDESAAKKIEKDKEIAAKMNREKIYQKLIAIANLKYKQSLIEIDSILSSAKFEANKMQNEEVSKAQTAYYNALDAEKNNTQRGRFRSIENEKLRLSKLKANDEAHKKIALALAEAEYKRVEARSRLDQAINEAKIKRDDTQNNYVEGTSVHNDGGNIQTTPEANNSWVEHPIIPGPPIAMENNETTIVEVKGASQVGNAAQLIMHLLDYANKDGGTNHETEIEDIKQKIDALSKPIKGERKSARALNDQALSLFNNGQLEEAVKLFSEAKRLDKSDPEILNNLGYALLKQGNIESAEGAILETLAISPGRSNAWQNLGDILGIKNDMPRAVAAYENVYRFSKNRVKTHQFMQKLNTNDVSTLKNARQVAMDWAEKMFVDENLQQITQAPNSAIELTTSGSADALTIDTKSNDALFGNWGGSVSQPGYGSYNTLMSFHDTNGTVEYPSLKCGGTVKILSKSGNEYRFLEHITYGRCIDNGVISVKVQGNSMDWKWQGSGITSTAILTR